MTRSSTLPPPRAWTRAISAPRPDPDQVPLTNLGKVLYPATGFTKGAMIAYYRAIAPALLPHLAGRPVSLKRLPDGVEGISFFEKRAPASRPPWVDTARVSSTRHGHLDYVVVEHPATLLWLANRAALELHTCLFRAPAEHAPTAVVFDLDPGPPAGLDACLPLALALRDLLDGLGLRSFPKTSGGKGLHVLVPLDGSAGFDRTKAFALATARVLAQRHPGRVTTVMAKDQRPGKVLIDWSQNDHGKTTVCAYSLRARPEPTVSTPVSWEEVSRAERTRRPERLVFLATGVPARVAKLGDLHAPVLTLEQRLPRLF